MNVMEWLSLVRKNPQESPIPPVPPEDGLRKMSGNTGIPPVPPCDSKHFVEDENYLPGTKPEQKETYWGDELEPGSSGGVRGNQRFYVRNQDLPSKWDRGKPEITAVSETAPPPDKSLPLPFLTADGTLSIPFDSDPKYHWWESGQSVAQTRAEVLARMGAQLDAGVGVTIGEKCGEVDGRAGTVAQK